MTKKTVLFAAAVAGLGACSQAGATDSTAGAPGGSSQAPLATPPPAELQARLDELDACMSRLQETSATFKTQSIQDEAELPAILYVYYNLDERMIHDAFTENIAGFNDTCELHANDAIGAVRGVLEPKPGAVVDPSDPESKIDIFTDVCGLRVINNESSWYEGWLISDLRVPSVRDANPDGTAQFGHITQADADLLAKIGDGHNIPGKIFTIDGTDVSFQIRHNTVAIPVSLGAWNTLQGEDGHAYWELNEYTNFTPPLYELAATGGLDNDYQNGRQYAPLGGISFNVDSRIPGSGPHGVLHDTSVSGKVRYGDDPFRPRDADRDPETCGEDSPFAETRLRFLPSGLAAEIMRDVYLRLASFEPGVTNFKIRLFDAYAYEVKLVDENGDGVLAFTETDIEDESNNLPNKRLYLPPNKFNRVAITRELNDGLLLPRFMPTQNAYVLHGLANFVPVTPFTVPGGDEGSKTSTAGPSEDDI